MAGLVAFAAGEGPASAAGDVERTGTIPSRPGVERSAGPDWSGEDGGSGHPLMTAAAIRAAAANFPNCIERMWPQAARQRISRATFDRLTAGLAPDLRIMDLLDSQPEFTKAIWDYLDILVNERRVERGREMQAKYSAQFGAAERAYGVDRHIIAAIWGVETAYGAIRGARSVLRSPSTP